MNARRGFTLLQFLWIGVVLWAVAMTIAVVLLALGLRRVDRNGKDLTLWAAQVHAWVPFAHHGGPEPCTAPGVPPGCTDPPPTPPPPPDWD